MADANFTSFLGGEWSPYSQGRLEEPFYKQALNTCVNALPIEEGPWCRRSGTAEFGPTFHMYPGIVREFLLPDGTSAVMEITYNGVSGIVRFWASPNAPNTVGLVADSSDLIVSISADTPAILETLLPHNWTDDDIVTITIDPTIPNTNAPQLKNRQLAITNLGIPAPTSNGALTSVASGSLAGATYYVRSTYVTAAGETTPAPETNAVVAINHVLNVASPATETGATGWNVYVSTSAGTETRQNTTPIAIGTAWQEPNTGLIAGNALPNVNTATGIYYYLYDMLSGQAVDGSALGIITLGNSYINHVLALAPPYTSLTTVNQIQAFQDNLNLYLFAPGYTTQIITLTPTYTGTILTAVDFALSAMDYGASDGPYLDPPVGAGNSQTGDDLAYVVKGADWQHLTFALASGSDGYSFTSGDVGKGIRIWTQPAPYDSAYNYSYGNQVTYSNAFWSAAYATSALPANTAPGTSTTLSASPNPIVLPWAADPTAGFWLAGTIESINSSTSVNIYLYGQIPGINFQGILQYNGTGDARNNGAYYTDGAGNPADTTGAMIDTYQIGAFGDGIFPTCGGLYEGRVYLGGAIPNRLDTTTNGLLPGPALANNTQAFSGTDLNGNVLDTSAISYTLSGTGQNNIQWFAGDVQGIVVSTMGDEHVISASTIGDPITPTSIQIHRSTHYLAAPTQPIHVGHALIFLQKDRRKVFEYIANIWGPSKFVGRHINENARHLVALGGSPVPRLNDLAYTEELTPVIWTYNASGFLLGCTYRRISNFPTEPPLFNAWHRHQLGTNRLVISLCHSAGLCGAIEAPALMTQESNGNCFVEMVSQLFDENSPITSAWYVDAVPFGGSAGGGTGIVGTDNPTNAPPGPPYSTAAGKYYFEYKVGAVSNAQVTGAYVGFANTTQRNYTKVGKDQLVTVLPPTTVENGAYGVVGLEGSPGGLAYMQGRDSNSAVVRYYNNPDAFIAGSTINDVPGGKWNTGDFIGIAVDTINGKFWVRNWTQTPDGNMNGTGDWEGGGSPQLATGGYDISGISGSLYITFGAPGRPTDSVTLNAGAGWPVSYGATPFYGLDGTAVIPTGYVAWDTTGNTCWDASQAAAAVLECESTTLSPAFGSKLAAVLSNSSLTATISTNSNWGDSGQLYVSTWNTAVTYPLGCFLQDGGTGSMTLNGLYFDPVGHASGGNQPVGDNSYESACITVISNTYKLRT